MMAVQERGCDDIIYSITPFLSHPCAVYSLTTPEIKNSFPHNKLSYKEGYPNLRISDKKDKLENFLGGDVLNFPIGFTDLHTNKSD